MVGTFYVMGVADNGTYSTLPSGVIFDAAPSNVPWILPACDAYPRGEPRRGPSPAGSWYTGPNVTSIACAGESAAVQIVMTVAGNLWYGEMFQGVVDAHSEGAYGLLRNGWTHIHGPVNEGIGSMTAVACASDAHVLHIVGLVAGNVWYTSRSPDGGWGPFVHIHGPNNEGRGPVTNASCALVDGALHVIALCDSALWKTTRTPSGIWDTFAAFYTRAGGPPESLDCAALDNGELHLVGVFANDQTIWHGMFGADGTWSPFTSVSTVDNIGAVACATDGQELFVVAGRNGEVTGNIDEYNAVAVIYATRRAADGSWHSFGPNGDVAPFGSYATSAPDGAPPGWITYGGMIGVGYSSRSVFEGQFIWVAGGADDGIYRVVGGAPVFVTTWANVGGQQDLFDTFDALPALEAVPVDGTFISGYTSGYVFRVAGGAPIYVSNWANVGGVQPCTAVDDAAIESAGGQSPFDHLNLVPADGTFIQGYQTGRIYQIRDGAPVYVPDWSAAGGPQPYVAVDQAAIDNAGAASPWNHLRAVVRRIGVVNSEHQLVVKEGALDAAWTLESDDVQAFALAGDRIGVVNSQHQLSVKEGDLDAAWTLESDDVQAFALAGDRIGVVNSQHQLSVKEGDLDAGWDLEYNEVQAFALCGERIGVVTTQHQLFVKEGALDAAWTLESDDVQAFALAGDRIGVVNSQHQLSVKEGDLDAAWTLESDDVQAFALAGDRIGVVSSSTSYRSRRATSTQRGRWRVMMCRRSLWLATASAS